MKSTRLIAILGLYLITLPILAQTSKPVMVCIGTDTTYYSTFPAALTAANKAPQATIQLLDDVMFGGAAKAQTIKTHLTLDLNGFSLGDTLTGTSLLYLNTDTLSLHLTSSRPGGRVWATRAYNGRIYAVWGSKGRLLVDHVRIEAQNTALYDEDNCKSVAVTALSVGTQGSLQMDDCEVVCSADRNAYGVTLYNHTSISRTRIHVYSHDRGYGLYTSSDTAHYHLSNSQITTEVALLYSYGVYVTKGNLDAEDCTFTAVCHQDTARSKAAECYTRAVAASKNTRLTLRRCTARATGTNATAAKGVTGVSGNATAVLLIEDCDIRSEGTETTYGVNGGSQLQISRCRIDASAARTTAYGVLVNLYTDSLSGQHATASVNDCRVRLSSPLKTYGIYTKAPTLLLRDSVDSYAMDSTAYALYVTTTCDSVRVNDCCLRIQTPKKGYLFNKSTPMIGRLLFYGGYYSHDTDLQSYCPDGWHVYRLYDEQMMAAGYRYALRPVSDPQVVVARLFDTRTGEHLADYLRLADALRYTQYTDERDFTIVVTGPCPLDSGTYYVADYVRLVVAYREDQNSAIGIVAQRAKTNSTKRRLFARLDLMDHAELIVEGMLEISGVQQGESVVCGTVSGEYGYGQLHLAPTASVYLERGAQMQAWGYVTGKGTVTVSSGATVRECLQLGDWKGGTVSYEMNNNPQRVFPITHFFYQNIEAPVVYLPGSKALGATTVRVSEYAAKHDDIPLIDSRNALFVLHDEPEHSSWVRKEYDPITDRMIWTVQGDVSLEELSFRVDAGFGIQFSMLSTQYILPIGTNTTIRVLSGSLSIPHDVVMLPGAVTEIAPEAQLLLPSSAHLYLYDVAQWGAYRDKFCTTVTYSPSWDTCPRDTVLSSARMVVGGSVLVEGALYTTLGGAHIIGCDSTEGEIVLLNGAAKNDVLYQLTGTYADHRYTPQTVISAALRNADSTLTDTRGAAAGERFVYRNGAWQGTLIIPPDTVPVILPDTVPVVPPDTVPVVPPDTVPVVQPDTTQQEGLTVPAAVRPAGRLVMRDGVLYILMPDGRMYTLTGRRVLAL